MFQFKGTIIRPNMKTQSLVHSDSAHTMGSHIVYNLLTLKFMYLCINFNAKTINV